MATKAAKLDKGSISERIAAWREAGSNDPASDTIATWLLDGSIPEERMAYPVDAYSLSCCLVLIQAVPEFLERLPDLARLPAAHGRVWAALAARWAELKNTYDVEAVELGPDAETAEYVETNNLLTAITEPAEKEPEAEKVVHLPTVRTIGAHGEVPTAADPTDQGQPAKKEKKKKRGKKAGDNAGGDGGDGGGKDVGQQHSELDFTPGSKDAESLVEFCRRIESLTDALAPIEEELAAVKKDLKAAKDDINGVYNQAKDYGFDKQTVQWLLARRKETPETRVFIARQRTDYAKATGLQMEMTL